MFLRFDPLPLLDDLCAHFRRAGFTATPAGGTVIEVRRPDAPNADQERRESDRHLRVWAATNSGVDVQRLP